MKREVINGAIEVASYLRKNEDLRIGQALKVVLMCLPPIFFFSGLLIRWLQADFKILTAIWLRAYKNAWNIGCSMMACLLTFPHVQQCRSFFAMKLLRTYLKSCTSIVQAVLCCLTNCCLDQTRRLTLFALEICPNLCQLMTRSPLECCTSIVQSSPLVQASSSLSMGHTRS